MPYYRVEYEITCLAGFGEIHECTIPNLSKPSEYREYRNLQEAQKGFKPTIELKYFCIDYNYSSNGLTDLEFRVRARVCQKK